MAPSSDPHWSIPKAREEGDKAKNRDNHDQSANGDINIANGHASVPSIRATVMQVSQLSMRSHPELQPQLGHGARGDTVPLNLALSELTISSAARSDVQSTDSRTSFLLSPRVSRLQALREEGAQSDAYTNASRYLQRTEVSRRECGRDAAQSRPSGRGK
ncbi:hypothetical protein BJX64DRAFT_295005 [Aspergillus heterothallicus]